MKLFTRFREHQPADSAQSPAAPAVSPRAMLVANHAWQELAGAGPEGRDALVAELRRIAALDPLPRKLARAGTPDPQETFPLILALVGLDDPSVPPLLAELLTGFPDNADPMRSQLIEGLARTRTELAADVLVEMSVCPAAPSFGGDYAGDMLAAHRPSDTLPKVLAHTSDTDTGHRSRAARLLGRLGDPDAVPTLHGMVLDPEASVREAVLGALGALRDPRSVLPLLVAEERDRRTRRHGYPAVAYDGVPSPAMVALDDVVGGEAASFSRWEQRDDPLAVEAGIVERLSDVRTRSWPQVTDSLSGLLDPEPGPPSIVLLLERLDGRGAEPEPPDGLRFYEPGKFDLALRRCLALGCTAGPKSSSEVLPDPQGGEYWWETTPVTCADGIARLSLRAGYAPMY